MTKVGGLCLPVTPGKVGTDGNEVGAPVQGVGAWPPLCISTGEEHPKCHQTKPASPAAPSLQQRRPAPTGQPVEIQEPSPPEVLQTQLGLLQLPEAFALISCFRLCWPGVADGGNSVDLVCLTGGLVLSGNGDRRGIL